MTKKDLGYSLTTYGRGKTGYKTRKYVEGMLTKEQALRKAVKLCTSTNLVDIDKEWETVDRYGESEEHSRTFGTVHMVKRKTGNAYVIQTFDKDGWESYTYDLKADGKMTNRR